jgi:hypothetical protein
VVEWEGGLVVKEKDRPRGGNSGLRMDRSRSKLLFPRKQAANSAPVFRGKNQARLGDAPKPGR